MKRSPATGATGRSGRRGDQDPQLRVDPIACRAHGLCAEIAPELIELDEWGYPLLARGPIPRRLRDEAARAVADCPTRALRLERPAG